VFGLGVAVCVCVVWEVDDAPPAAAVETATAMLVLVSCLTRTLLDVTLRMSVTVFEVLAAGSLELTEDFAVLNQRGTVKIDDFHGLLGSSFL
jgi:hypothetical protein